MPSSSAPVNMTYSTVDDLSSTYKVDPDTRGVSPVFAVIIGINTYADSSMNLKGACADADEVSDFVRNRLGAPSDQVLELRNEKATRDAIISALKDLAVDIRIKKGNPILIYFAGHGKEARPPPEWGSHERVIQMLLPYDFSRKSVQSEEGQGLLDITLAELLMRIADAKDNNITVILDCCYSGSGTRPPDQDWIPRTITLPSDYAIFPGVDHELLFGKNDGSVLRGSNVPTESLHHGLHSHVLLAACKPNEKAREILERRRGAFTEALMKKLKEVNLRNVTYEGLIRSLEPISKTQHPQCESYHRARKLFNAAVSTIAEPQMYPVIRERDTYTMLAGASLGIEQGTHFDVYSNHIIPPETSSLGTLAVQTVNEFQSIMQPVSEQPWSFGTEGFAIPVCRRLIVPPSTVTSIENSQKSLRVFVYDTGSDLCNIVRSVERGGVGEEAGVHRGAHFQTVTDERHAHIGITTKEGNLVFSILDERCTKYGLIRIYDEPAFNRERLTAILRCAAHFYFFRDLGSSSDSDANNPLKNNIWVECWAVKRVGGSARDKTVIFVEDKKNPIENGVITIPVQDSNKAVAKSASTYGFKVFSSFNQPVFVWAFYFDNSDFSISPYYIPPSSGIDAIEPSLPEAGSPEDPRMLTIGYGSAGARPHDFFLRKHQDVDVGFLKIFVTTQYVDYQGISQDSPFQSNRRTGSMLVDKPDEAWTALVVPVVQKRVKG